MYLCSMYVRTYVCMLVYVYLYVYAFVYVHMNLQINTGHLPSVRIRTISQCSVSPLSSSLCAFLPLINYAELCRSLLLCLSSQAAHLTTVRQSVYIHSFPINILLLVYLNYPVSAIHFF